MSSRRVFEPRGEATLGGGIPPLGGFGLRESPAQLARRSHCRGGHKENPNPEAHGFPWSGESQDCEQCACDAGCACSDALESARQKCCQAPHDPTNTLYVVWSPTCVACGNRSRCEATMHARQAHCKVDGNYRVQPQAFGWPFSEDSLGCQTCSPDGRLGCRQKLARDKQCVPKGKRTHRPGDFNYPFKEDDKACVACGHCAS